MLIRFFPLIIVLISIALLGNTEFWHKHYKKFSIFMFLVAMCDVSMHNEIFLSLINEYIPFVTLIFALFVVSSKINVIVNGNGLYTNIKIFLIGAFLSALLGTMGSSMIMIRPLLNSNINRPIQHTIVFFIMIVSNISGAMSSLGDPPLFLGYLSGVPFFWPTINLFMPCIASIFVLLVLYILSDMFITGEKIKYTDSSIKIFGAENFFLIFIIIFITIFSNSLNIHSIFVRDLPIFIIAMSSYRKNINIGPVIEVAYLFFAIFSTSVLVMHEIQNINFQISFNECLWVSGLMSSFLDNAPTYMMFYELIGGYDNANFSLLKAISIGSVFMGGMTYIGNAPNMIVRSIALKKSLKMPSFLGYIMLTAPILSSIMYLISVLI